MNVKISRLSLNRFTIVILMMCFLFIPNLEDVEAEENSDAKIMFQANVDRELHYDQHALLELEIDNKANLGITEIVADLSQLGGPDQFFISPELNCVTISVRSDIEPGVKDIHVKLIDENGDTYTTSTTATVIPREKEENERDWDEAVIYFMLTDRFYDGDSNNNDPYQIDYRAITDNPRGTYQGGDFKGITENLDYLQRLGINTIWITPIVENIGHNVEYKSDAGSYFAYHGYWAKDFERLNPHLGTLEEFHALIDQAAERGIDIMVDVVLNHSGYGLKGTDEVTEPPVGYPTSDDRSRFMGMLRDRSGAGDVKMELSGLPDFKTEEDWIRRQLVEWQAAWIEKSTTPNGNAIKSYRVDTVKHVDNVTWQHFKNELVRIDSSFKLIGEAWGANYQDDLGYLNSGMMDSLLDFGFKDHARHFVNGSLEEANKLLIERNQSISNIATLGQFLGSHDEDGFLYRLINNGDSEEVAQGKLKLAATLQITSKGQPVIYYGEELGQSGAENWPEYDNRYDFDWALTENNHILEHYQRLLEFRSSFSELLSRGDRSMIGGSNDAEWLLVERSYQDNSVYLGFNLAKTKQEIKLIVSEKDAMITDHYTGKTYQSIEDSNGESYVLISMPDLFDGGTILLSVDKGEILSSEQSIEPIDSEDEESLNQSAIENRSNVLIIVMCLVLIIGLAGTILLVTKIKRRKR